MRLARNRLTSLYHAYSFMLQLSLGDINVTLPRIGDRMRYKTHYENFKLKMTVVGLIFTGAYVCLTLFACCFKPAGRQLNASYQTVLR